MNDSEEEKKPDEELQLVSFDDYIASIEVDTELMPIDAVDKIQDVKDGTIFLLKQLKSCIEQSDFLHAFQDKYDLKVVLLKSEDTFERFLVDTAIFQEANFDVLQTIQEEDVTFLPEVFDFIFLEPDKFEKLLVKKKRVKLYDLLRETKNTELILPDKILDRERSKPIIQQDIITIKDELGKGDKRLKKIRKVAPGLKDVLDKFEAQRIIQISVLIYYYYRLSNEDVEIDKGLSKVFPEIKEAQKKLVELEKKLKKNNADNKSEKEKKTETKEA